MVDVDSVIGKPITTPDGTTVIPISKVSYGFASEVQTFQLNLNLPKISSAAVQVQVLPLLQLHFYLFATVM
ncbi:MAG: spore germination protein GerW family protein [Acutalibacteraceae bacterium]